MSALESIWTLGCLGTVIFVAVCVLLIVIAYA